MHRGYYRFPTLHDDTLVFNCEDDLWTVPLSGGIPRRLTASEGESTHAHLSPDGRWLAFTGREEGHVEVYVMPADGGPATRLTFLGAVSLVTGWSADGQTILFATNACRPFAREFVLNGVPLSGGEPKALPWGPARHIAYGPNGGVVLGRNTGDPARWKRYRGGTAGDLWIDAEGRGEFRRLAVDAGNPTTPMWIGDRVYFLADHEGIGNLYSCRPDGSELRRHTDHEDYYARQASTDGKRIVYHAGADIYLFDPATGESRLVPIEMHSPAPQLNRKFVRPARYLDGAALHPKGRAVALTTRGKLFAMPNWAGAPVQLGEPNGVRYRHPAWLCDGERVVAVTDALGEETLAVFRADGTGEPELLGEQDLGLVVDLVVSPKAEKVAIANHRHEVLLVDLAEKRVTRVERSEHGRIGGLAWSPDGAYLAYGFPDTAKTSCIKLLVLETGETHRVTEPVMHDTAPAFDPKGDYLYFISYRVFDPVYDNLHFDLGFPKGVKPCLVTLRPDVPSPFVPRADEPEKDKDDEKDKEGDDDASDEAVKPLRIELEGIARRVVVFPVPEGRYLQVLGLDGRVMFTQGRPTGALSADDGGALLQVYDFANQKRETLMDGVAWVNVSDDAKCMLVGAKRRLRVLGAGDKPKGDGPSEPGRESGWLDLERLKVSVVPQSEWRQMFYEAWRLQRHHFWTEDMSAVDWDVVRDRYVPLLDRLASRAEFSDLLWEMLGELGTSHAYEYGGDYKPVPRYDQGHLGAEFVWDEASSGYRILRIVHGQPGEVDHDSPLNRVGVDVREGDVLLAVGGRRLSRTFSPNQALVHMAEQEVALTLAPRNGEGPRVVYVRTLEDEQPARYRAWVEANRARVHAASGGRLGYLHIPDMSAEGYAEFHRGFLVEARREGLVVDVRYNGGGHVSQLLLEKLGRKRIGYDVERWGGVRPFPDDSVEGPMVALTNEHAGSDGDIFSHCFKLMQLGPLLGKRTWGGVIGIWPRHLLVDGTVTTQPEFSFWFKDVGWGVENYGTEPDVEVDITPQAHAQGEDTQLERSIALALELLEANPPSKPDFTRRPKLAAPKLPARP